MMQRSRAALMLERLLPRRLDRQVMLLVTLLLGLVMPYFALHEADESADRVVESATRQAQALAQNIAVTSVAHIVIQDFASSEQLLLRSAQFPGVLEIQVSDVAGRVIADVLNQADAEAQLRYDLQPLTPPAQLHAAVLEEEGLLTIWQPVIGASAVGWVRLRYSLAEAEEIARNYFYDYLIDGAIVTVLLVTLILLVMRRPLRMLRSAASFAAQLTDKSGARIGVDHSSIEIEQLGRALNAASANLFEQEMTIRKALKALNTQKSALDEHSIVSITDVEGNITYANQKFLDATGYRRDELLGKKHSIVKSGYHSDAFFREMWTTISSGRVWHGEIKNKAKDGREIWVNTTIVPFMDESGRPYEYVGIRTDITERKRIEAELAEKARTLRQMTDHLEELVQQRTAELEAANTQLQHLNKIKSEFVSVVSHELRTPLTSIKSFAEILQDDLELLDIQSQKHFLSIINEESERLGRLINDLLDLQKMESGKMVWKAQRLNLADLLRSSVELFEQAYRDKGLVLQLEMAAGNFCLDMDADRIKQLVANLLSNALKFTASGSVSVTLRAKPGQAEVCVSDTGMGIPADELERIFEHFHQVNRAGMSEIGGSGLGLAICREIVEHYGGRIWAESTQGQGSRFYFTLPLARADEKKS